MCGIVGLMTSRAESAASLERYAEEMSSCIVHRGPDDSGTWSQPEAGVAFGFRRLSIIDLSRAGHQPMRSASGRFTMVFNGEVYNYVELRRELETDGSAFRGHSDTEVMLHAFERWGIEAAVSRFIGMFAIGVWDAETRRLSLIRDRLGIKPLFYFHRAGILTFGSELKALVAGPRFDRSVDHDAISEFLRYLYVPAPNTIYKYVRKLLPGHILTVDTVASELPESKPYWSLDDAYERGRANPFVGSDAEAVAELRRILTDSVRLRMRSDVPMGALLSSGIDSTTVVGLMQAIATQPTRTFTIGFPGTAHDEARHAARIASVLGTQHTEMSVTGDDALAVVPSLPDLFDEPFADPSEIPTYLVCKLARTEVTVALTGDGGDEVFAGYERYIQGERFIRRGQRIPRVLRRVAGAAIRSGSEQFWDRAYRGVTRAGVAPGGQRLIGEKMLKLGHLLAEGSEAGMYRSLLSAGWRRADVSSARPFGVSGRLDELLARHSGIPLLDRMMLIDQQTYLPDDMLAKIDRVSMAVSLEARVPLLDHRVVEFAWRLQQRHKVREGRGKWALRQVAYGLVDRELLERPKVGFSIPIAAWLRGPLREWAQDLLFSGSATGPDSWLSQSAVRQAWNDLEAGAENWSVWTAVMLQAWRQRWIG